MNDDCLKPNEFLNIQFGVIGKTASTRAEPNTTSSFHFWISAEDSAKGKIEIGNIIAAYSEGNDDVTFGIVTEMRSYSDIDSFISDFLSHDFGKATLTTPTDVAEVIVVSCSVMNNISGKTRPVEKSKVYYPSPLGVQFAYGIVDKSGRNISAGASIPIGIFQNGDDSKVEISVDDDFLIGPEAAHLNVSGISGLASKTSTVQFIIKSLLSRTKKKVAVIMFNVKSKDLLYVDQENNKLKSDAWSQEAYALLGFDTKPFTQAQFFAPFYKQQIISERRTKIAGFTWNLEMLKDDIPDLFEADDWDDKMEGLWYTIRETMDLNTFSDYQGMLNWINSTIRFSTRMQPPNQWPLGNNIATWRKMNARLQAFPQTYKGLISLDSNANDIPISSLKDRDVFVIDIEKLDDKGKRLIFGRIINEIGKKLNSKKLNVERVIIFVDELNKFAPSSNIRSPLKRKIVEITARGRSLGLILFGAEQFASTVDKEVVENSSTFLYGRTEAAELSSINYSKFSNEIKSKISVLSQGNLLAKFAKFPQPIFIKFPYPPCPPGDQ
jgi:hypothetical protein